MQIDLSELQDEVVFRPMLRGDQNFILNSWLKSYRPSAKGVDTELYYFQHHKVALKAVLKSGVIVAANREDPSQILGYVVFENFDGLVAIHYAYVKAPFRNLGVATALIQKASMGARSIHHSHETLASHQLVKHFQSVFNPYLAY